MSDSFNLANQQTSSKNDEGRFLLKAGGNRQHWIH